MRNLKSLLRDLSQPISNFKNVIFPSIAAGILIGIAAHTFSQYALLGSIEKILVAVLFSGALCSIKFLKLNLFTGAIGYVTRENIKTDIPKVLTILFGNLIGTFLVSAFCLSQESVLILSSKISYEDLFPFLLLTFGKSILCGILMYAAVEIFERQSLAGILMMVPMFLLAGFEHSIANSFYLFNAIIMGYTPGMIAIVIFCVWVLGNSIGSILFRKITRK